MNVLYICKVSDYQVFGNQIDIPKKIGVEFFKVPELNIENKINTSITICHSSNLQQFETVELQPATNLRFSTRLNTFLLENGDIINEGDLIVFEKIGRCYSVRCIKKDNTLFSSLMELFDEGEKHMYISANFQNDDILHLQKIYYGAPGTGKSNAIKEDTREKNGKEKYSKDFIFRTTFHPDSDYASFVGAYKPIWDDTKDKIIYEFRPQSFLKAYIQAWTNLDKNVALVIEEINRGNCAQIFGDIFQLLDRYDEGWSKYPIEADVDMQKYLERAFNSNFGDTEGKYKEAITNLYKDHYTDAFDKIKEGKILTLPHNLSILATMNTSDQSLFPMDSAFKRRWDWEYMPIKDERKNWKIEVDDKYENVDWWKFLERINAVIAELTTAEDKQLGYYFCMPDKRSSSNITKREDWDVITANHFVSKVIFYLWNDVFKDYAFDPHCCKDENGKEVLFAQFYNDVNNVNTKVLSRFFEALDKDNDKHLLKDKTKPDENKSSEEVEEAKGSALNETQQESAAENPEDTDNNANEE